MNRITPALFALVLVGCAPNDADNDAGTLDGGEDAGQSDSGVSDSGVIGLIDSGVIDSGVIDSGVIDSGVIDSGDPDEASLSCDVPAGGDEDDVELMQAWSAFVADESHFNCAQDTDCVLVNYQPQSVDWCSCLSGGLTSKWGIAVNAASASEAEAMTDRGWSEDCQELRDLLNDASCDGNPPIGAVCVDNRCAHAFDPCGWCGTNGCEDAGPG